MIVDSLITFLFTVPSLGAQWLSGRVLDSRLKGRGLEPHPRHCVVSLSKNINPSLVLVQPRKTRPFITERLLMGRKESNQTKQTVPGFYYEILHRNYKKMKWSFSYHFYVKLSLYDMTHLVSFIIKMVHSYGPQV